MNAQAAPIKTGDLYKDEVQNQWDNNPCGSQYVKEAQQHTLEWYLEVERYRYVEYAPWMPKVMEFADHAGEDLLEVGGGIGTDHAQFAKHGVRTTDVDLSSGHLALAQENFRLRGLTGRFVHHDAETIPFPDDSFDVVYSNGVIHHTPNTDRVVAEMFRVLRPGGKAIVMVYAENSIYYWRSLVMGLGLRDRMLETYSIGEIMSRSVEMTSTGSRPLVKVYTKPRLRALFSQFERISIEQHQLVAAEVPRGLRWVPLPWLGRLMGWNLVIKAYKPRRAG
jgi:ubiquinone/menaquinone biosynthesis C-methylase UbiE